MKSWWKRLLSVGAFASLGAAACDNASSDDGEPNAAKGGAHTGTGGSAGARAGSGDAGDSGDTTDGGSPGTAGDGGDPGGGSPGTAGDGGDPGGEGGDPGRGGSAGKGGASGRGGGTSTGGTSGASGSNGEGGANGCDDLDCIHGSCEAGGARPRCACEPGYRGHLCQADIDECATSNGGCDPLVECTNVPGSRTCGECPQGYTGNGEAGCAPPTCNAPDDCAVLGPSPTCTVWVCENNRCVSAPPQCPDVDGDGLSSGPDCACGPTDCNDGNSTLGNTKDCYSGPNGTRDVGVCRGGTSRCTSAGDLSCLGERVPTGETCNGEDDDCDGETDELGVVTCGIGVCARTIAACVGGVLSVCAPGDPASDVDGCNGLDDDCDGAVDEDCATCLHVSPAGDDAAAAASNGATPFLNVQPAIDFADTHRAVATRVCVAAGAACGATATYAGPPGDFTMRNGIAVLANYRSSDFARCADSTTHLAPATGAGILFPAAIALPTALDGFTIDRAGAAGTAGVTVDGARGVVLSNLVITGATAATRSYGVNVTNGGDTTIFRGTIDGGMGTAESIGVRVANARALVRDSTIGGIATPGPGLSYAVLLENAPASVIDGSTLSSLTDRRSPDNAAIRVVGDANGLLIRNNNVHAAGYANRYDPPNPSYTNGIWMETCAGAAPRIVGNHILAEARVVEESWKVAAISSLGDCHPVIESNGSIVAADVYLTVPIGVDCGELDGVSSRCTIAQNGDIHATYAFDSVPSLVRIGPYGYGVLCESGACARIANNHIVGMKANGNTVSAFTEVGGTGLFLERSGAFVDGNTIGGGCARRRATVGVKAVDSSARIQNNEITGFLEYCPPYNSSVPNVSATGISVVAAAGLHELDVHSNLVRQGNYFDYDNAGAAAPSAAIALEVTTGSAPPEARGIFRSNYLLPLLVAYSGPSTRQFPLMESSPAADPWIFDNNVMPNGTMGDADRGAVYLDEGATPLIYAADVNALADIETSGNIDECAVAFDPFRLLSGSACIDSGTPLGAPGWDIERQPRDARPDIGPNEYSP